MRRRSSGWAASSRRPGQGSSATASASASHSGAFRRVRRSASCSAAWERVAHLVPAGVIFVVSIAAGAGDDARLGPPLQLMPPGPRGVIVGLRHDARRESVLLTGPLIAGAAIDILSPYLDDTRGVSRRSGRFWACRSARDPLVRPALSGGAEGRPGEPKAGADRLRRSAHMTCRAPQRPHRHCAARAERPSETPASAFAARGRDPGQRDEVLSRSKKMARNTGGARHRAKQAERTPAPVQEAEGDPPSRSSGASGRGCRRSRRRGYACRSTRPRACRARQALRRAFVT